MTQFALFFNSIKCIGCYSCEVACKQENDIPVGPRWIHLKRSERKQSTGKPDIKYELKRCMHCGNPLCKEACPVGAIEKTINGAVIINKDRCIGCKQCIEACPFHAPQYNEVSNLVEMCTLCNHRILSGRNPSCVENCMSKAIRFGEINEITRGLS